MTARPPARDLLCVPGLGLDGAAWRPTLEALTARPAVSARLEVAALPGYGERPRRGDDVRPQALAERLLDGPLAGRSALVLAGHSASCQVVAHAARLAPDRVEALVLVGPTTDPRCRGWGRLVARWLRTAVHERPGQVPTLLRTYSRCGPAHMLRAMDAARRDDVVATLAGVACPVVVVRGRHDRICPADWADAVAGAGPVGSRSLTLARGAHMVPLTHGPRLADVLADVLAAPP